MNKPRPSSVTPEEAVARMVNMDYIPDGCTLLEMTEAFLQEAEADVDEARTEGRPSHVRLRLEERLKACRFRHELAETLLAAIDAELKAGGPSLLVRADDGAPGTRLTTESVWEWSGDRYGIGIPEWAASVADTAEGPDQAPAFHWTAVTIKIYENHRLAWSCLQGGWTQARFADLGLMGRRKHEPNEVGKTLIALSIGERYPPRGSLLPRHKTLMSRLRGSLLRLTGLTGDPFYPLNAGDGWKPRFRLIDDTRNADERAKREARTAPLEDWHGKREPRDYVQEDDDAGQFLDEHDRG